MSDITDPDVRPRAVVAAALCVLAMVLAALLTAWLSWRHWEPDGPKPAPAIPIDGPLLEPAPQLERKEFERRQKAQRAQSPVFTPHIGAQLPLGLPLRDAAGHPAQLGDYFGTAPVLLVMGYYRCQNLCSLVFDDALQAALLSGAPDYRLVGVSIDPDEGTADAAPRQARYRALLGGRTGRAALLTGDAASTAALAKAVGFGYRYDASARQYLHPAGFVVATPQGRVVRYFTGLRYRPQEVRRALEGDGRDGAVEQWAQQVQLLCARLDPFGGHEGAVWMALRLAGLAGVVLLAAVLWRAHIRRLR